MILSETAATRLLVDDGCVAGIRTGDKGRGRDGEELGNFEPGSDLLARVTVLAEGVQGYLTEAALDRFALRGEAPQTWELGVKEVWRVPAGWTGSSTRWGGRSAPARSTGSSAARSSIRWATTCSRSGWWSGSTTATRRSRCTTCSRS